MNVLGIDPGLSGAIAQWDGRTLELLGMPTVKASGRGREVAWSELNQMWDAMFFYADHVFLESVHSMPGQGVSSVFKFGECFGGLRGMIAAKMLPITLVTPGKWKKAYSLVAQKDAAVRRASQLFPASAHLFRGPKGGLRDGLAEAALIARYGYDQLKG